MTAQLSRERLEALANLQSLECMALPASHAESAAMARMLLAGMDSEPVAVIDKEGSPMTRAECNDDRVFAICCKVGTPLYTAPPAPVAVPDEVTVWTDSENTAKRFWQKGWNACRAAMLKAGPVKGWIKCSERMPPLNNGQMWIYSPTRGVNFMFALAASGEYYDTCDSEEDITDATHWMPISIPAAPEQEV